MTSPSKEFKKGRRLILDQLLYVLQAAQDDENEIFKPVWDQIEPASDRQEGAVEELKSLIDLIQVRRRQV